MVLDFQNEGKARQIDRIPGKFTREKTLLYSESLLDQAQNQQIDVLPPFSVALGAGNDNDPVFRSENCFEFLFQLLGGDAFRPVRLAEDANAHTRVLQYVNNSIG
jgi:hypothetical protein